MNDHSPERRGTSWSGFRETYPILLNVCAALLLFLLAADWWLWYQRGRYIAEIERLRGAMTEAEREKSDLIIASEQDKLRMAFELARHQARWDPRLHLSVAVDSGRMYLERDGALLREVPVEIVPGPLLPGEVEADSGPTFMPRGERVVKEVVTDHPALVLAGGSRIVGATDTAALMPGDLRVPDSDLKAILPNISAGMLVYFY